MAKKIFRQLWLSHQEPFLLSAFKFQFPPPFLSTSNKPLFSMLSNLSVLFILTISFRLSGNSCQYIWSGEREEGRQGRQGLFFHAEWRSRWFTSSLFSWRPLKTVPSFQRIKFQKFIPLIKLNTLVEFSGYSFQYRMYL